MDHGEGVDGLEKAGLDGVDQIFAVGEEGVETGIFGIAPTEGEDIRGLRLEPFVEAGVGEFKVFLDVCLWVVGLSVSSYQVSKVLRPTEARD